MILLLLFVASLWAGAQNALAGGGSFLTLPALILTGMDARAANITSTLALFPAQCATGWASRSLVADAPNLSFRWLFIISLAGGAVGALLLLATPSSLFDAMVPWLVIVATGIFAYGSFRKKPLEAATKLGPIPTGIFQFVIAIYGGYFGGGIGFLMLAVLTIAGQSMRNAGGTKNVLAGVMNASAVLVFLFSPGLHWREALVVAAGATLGGLSGAWALHRVNERVLRIAIVGIGIALTIGLFWRRYG